MHGALDVTRNVVCSPHAHHLAQHSEHEEKPQPECFNFQAFLSVLVRSQIPVQENSQSENNTLQDEEDPLTHCCLSAVH